MDLGLTEDQEMLKKVAADFVKAEVPAHQMTQWFLNKKIFQTGDHQESRRARLAGHDVAGGIRRRWIVDNGLRGGIRSARPRPCARSAVYVRHIKRPDDF